MMPIPSLCRGLVLAVLTLLCSSCISPEERACAAFAELCAQMEQLRVELAGMTDADSVQRALPALEAQAEELRELLSGIDELAEDPDLPQEARQRVGAQYHEPLRAAVEAALHELHRMGRHSLYHSAGLKRLARREYAHYSQRGVHPWPRAVFAGREYRPRPPRQQSPGK